MQPRLLMKKIKEILLLHSKTGFTLIELSVSIACFMVFLGVLLPYGNGLIARHQNSNAQSNLAMLGKQCQFYFAREGVWPRRLSDLRPYIPNEAIFSQVIFKKEGQALVLQQGTYHLRINQKPSVYGVLFYGP